MRICGIEYYRDLDDDPIISKSEWGSYCYDGEADMKVLRKRAEGAVRYFNKGGKPRVDMQTNVFGYPFSIIDNGKLVDTENAYKGNVIIRALSYGGGIYEGKGHPVLQRRLQRRQGPGRFRLRPRSGMSRMSASRTDSSSYQAVTWANRSPTHTAYRNVQTTRGSCSPFPREARCLRRNLPPRDSRPSTITVRRSLRNPSLSLLPKPDPKPSVADMIYASMHDFCVLLEMLETGMEKAGQWYYQPYDGRKIPT